MAEYSVVGHISQCPLDDVLLSIQWTERKYGKKDAWMEGFGSDQLSAIVSGCSCGAYYLLPIHQKPFNNG